MGGYPPFYDPTFDLAQAQAGQDTPSATELAVELSNVSDSLNQAIGFIRALATSDRKLKPNTVLGTTLVVESEEVASAGQTEYLYPVGTTVDPQVATVGVFVNRERVAPSQVTIAVDRVTLDTPAIGGEIVVLEIHDNALSILSKLASTVENEGASLIGIEDINGLYGADTVEDALAEVKQGFENFVQAVGDLDTIIRSDGSVDFIANQSMGGFKLTDVKAGTDPKDAVNVEQLTLVLGQLVNVTDKFLARAGGSMLGSINMTNKRIVNVGAPVADGDAANKKYVDDSLAATASGRLALAGFAQSVLEGTLTGPVYFGSATGEDVATFDQTDSGADPIDPLNVPVPTVFGLPVPSAPSQAVNKYHLDQVVANLQSQIQNQGTGINPAGCVLDGAGLGAPIGILDPGGNFNFTTLSVFAPQALTVNSVIAAETTMSVAADIDCTGKDLTLTAGDSISITAGTITCRNLTIVTDALTVSAGVVFDVANKLTIITAADADIFSTDISAFHIDVEVAGDLDATGSIWTARDVEGTGVLTSNTIGPAESQGNPGTDGYGDGVGTVADGIGGTGGGGALAGSGSNAGRGGGTYNAGDGTDAEHTFGGLGAEDSAAFRPYLSPLASGAPGGRGIVANALRNYRSAAGGVIDIWAAGNITATGALFNASGQGFDPGDQAEGSGGTDQGSGGAGAGCARVATPGSMTGGEVRANGGDGGGVSGNESGGGGGGGGLAAAIAASFPAPATQANANAGSTGYGGSGPGEANPAVAGEAHIVTLTADQINCLHDSGKI